MLSGAIAEASLLAIGKNWAGSERARSKKRNAFYLSAEFLTGRLVYNNLFCMGVLDEVKQLLSEKGVDIAILEDVEDAALGNGGLGRLAACFLDSAATMDLPLTGYGLRYRYGLFKQEIVNGAQHEIPDDWTKYGDPWSVRMDEHAVVVEMATGNVLAVPYDMPVIGYGTENVGTLRLWQTESLNEFDFQAFNNYKYNEACANNNEAEDITK
ncbi:MAG: glycogen/starch/alpha-glucan phosphorylase, partial [Clostridia bacterium]|nr:glycogen/starch/alpha-glucan phosphorylase [Clostridia bacterium]